VYTIDMNILVDTIHGLFDALGGPAEVARIIGRGGSTASEMKRRASIPVDYWPALIESARGKEIGLTSDDLVRLHIVSRSQSSGVARGEGAAA
jgi:hypothetical protein